MNGRILMLTILLGCLLVAGGFFYFSSDEEEPLKGCEEKTIQELMICSEGEEAGCSYKFTDSSLDVREPGLKVGDVVEVCR